MDGIIFDIQKFALHDGPGMRTTVFFKACPLACAWCCNPESQNLQPQISFDREKCNTCGDCISACKLALISSFEDKITLNFKDCTACGLCTEVCPTDALRVIGYRTTAEKIIEEVMKDKDYFENSGGGLTISGGEALMQFDFLMDLLKLAKKNGLHTAIETSGFAEQDQFAQIMPFVDLFLFDFKLTDQELHKKYTLAGNSLILNNLDFLYRHSANILLRCPVIPGINDTSEHFQAISNLSLKYPALMGIEILKYHNYGLSKYEKIGFNDPYYKDQSVSELQLEKWIKQLQRLGCINIVNNFPLQ